MFVDPTKVLAGLRPDEAGAFPRDARTDVSVRPFPFPYIAGFAMSNDCDSQIPDVFEDWHAFVNGRRPTPYGDGLGLEVAESFWVYAGIGNSMMSIHAQPGDYKGDYVDSPTIPRLQELSRLGWFDTLHSLGNWLQDYKSVRHDLGHRDQAKYAMDKLASLGLKPDVYVNHSASPSNIGGPWAYYQKADDPDHPMYCMDLFREHGFRYFWLDVCLGMSKFGDYLEYANEAEVEQEVLNYPWGPYIRRRMPDETLIPADLPTETSALRDTLAGFMNRTINEVKGLDGKPLLAFKRFRGPDQPTASTFAIQATADNLDRLEQGRGAVVCYQHFGSFSALGRSNAVGLKVRRQSHVPALDEHAVACWRDIAERRDAGRLFVAATGRLLRYLWLRERLQFRVEKTPDTWIVHLDGIACAALGNQPVGEPDLNGLALLVPEEAPAVKVAVSGRSTPLAVHRRIDAAHPGRHAVFVPWKALEWPDRPAAN